MQRKRLVQSLLSLVAMALLLWWGGSALYHQHQENSHLTTALDDCSTLAAQMHDVRMQHIALARTYYATRLFGGTWRIESLPLHVLVPEGTGYLIHVLDSDHITIDAPVRLSTRSITGPGFNPLAKNRPYITQFTIVESPTRNRGRIRCERITI